MDTDGDGVVDYDEFSKFVEVGAVKQTKGSHRYAFTKSEIGALLFIIDLFTFQCSPRWCVQQLTIHTHTHTHTYTHTHTIHTTHTYTNV